MINIKGTEGLVKMFYASINAYNDNIDITYDEFTENINMNMLNEFAFCIADFNKLQDTNKKKVTGQENQ